MAKKKKAVAVPPVEPPVESMSLLARIEELEGDLVRVVDLLVKGDLDSANFLEILAKRQGKA